MLFKFKKVDSSLRGFCEKKMETIEHLFFHYITYTKVCMFWDELKVVLSSLNTLVRFDIKDVLLGILLCKSQWDTEW